MTISVPFFDWAGLWAERADEFGRIIHAHPTVSEAVMEAAEGVHDLSIHI